METQKWQFHTWHIIRKTEEAKMKNQKNKESLGPFVKQFSETHG